MNASGKFNYDSDHDLFTLKIKEYFIRENKVVLRVTDTEENLNEFLTNFDLHRQNNINED